MSQLFEMCQAIVNYPNSEMTVEDVVESMNGAGVNFHSIRCALSKIASKSVLVEPASKNRGRAKIYKKRSDIDAQWEWMMAHKSPTDRLVLPSTPTAKKTRQRPARVPVGKNKTRQTADRRHPEMPGADRIFKELTKIGKALGSIENAIRENTKALQAIEFAKPTVVVRKEKA